MAKAETKRTSKDIKETKEFASLRNLAKSIADKDYAEISDIRHDLDSLKDNVVALTRHLKRDGVEKAEDLKERMGEKLHDLRLKGEDSLDVLDDKIKDNPRSSILIAFAAGVVANFLLRRG